MAALAWGQPQDSEAHYNSGIALKNRGDLTAAKTEFRRAIELDPHFSAARFYLASILLAEGQPTLAIEQLKTTTRSPAVDRLLGLAYLESGKPTQAAGLFRSAVTAQPKDAEAHYYLGIAIGQRPPCASSKLPLP